MTPAFPFSAIVGHDQLRLALVGKDSASGGFVPSLRHVVEHIGETNVASLSLGVFGIAFLLAGRKLFPRWPISLTLVALSIALMSIFLKPIR